MVHEGQDLLAGQGDQGAQLPLHLPHGQRSHQQLQGCKSIDIMNLRLELDHKLRQGLRTRLEMRFLAVG